MRLIKSFSFDVDVKFNGNNLTNGTNQRLLTADDLD